MLFTTLSALMLAFSGVCGYENSSPFFFYSTSKIELPSTPALAPASSIHHLIDQALSSCPTKKYAVILQPGVSTDDYQCPKNTPFLAGRLGHPAESATNLMVRDVIEKVDVVGTGNVILMDCLHHGIKTVETIDTSALVLPELGAQKISENVIYAPMPAVASDLTKEERKVVLRNHDMYIEGLIDNYFGGEDFTLIYITESRHDAENKQETTGDYEYQMESEIPLVSHGELVKRAVGILKNSTSRSNQTIVDGPLFDKYQFFSPGIFMGLLVLFLLLMLGYVGISALASLQVTYGAFDKEQGQLAGKKGQ